MPINSWNTDKEQELFKLYVGETYPDLKSAADAKKHIASYIINYLNISTNDTVMDIGPGAGFIALNVAPYCKELYCVDISKSFIDQSKLILRNLNNVRFKLIKHGDFSNFSNVNKIYCMAVFIHFNIYDIAIYLENIYRLLPNEGQFLFDFLDADQLNPRDTVFIRHKEMYKKDKKVLQTNINFNSKKAVMSIANDIGFKIDIKRDDFQPMFLLTK